ncbi:GDSL esterase/lipase [Abeliophyllum distichum]|uniref:GDSL esterase/lipase n=1 Tax=Abeliophyllum distichum TaxID=126358 RepID=A0ABD1SYZ9_9LAMI
MELSILFLSLFHCLLLTTPGYICVQGSPNENQLYGFRPTKLFVFGDSYADTGNVRKSLANSWKEPYGTTFPGKPAGRFSDGRVLTDYLAKFLGLKSPIAYTWMKLGEKRLHYGMNFAYGGSGVFNTYNLLPNMSTQISFFEKLMNNDLVYTKWDLQSSLVLVALAGNDYAAYVSNNGTAKQTVEKLNKETQDSAFLVLDLYSSFTTVLEHKRDYSGNLKFETPLKPCCMGVSNGFFCGSVDENGAKMYTVCNDPKSAFFWDASHPTEAGWHAVYSALKPTLEQFF